MQLCPFWWSAIFLAVARQCCSGQLCVHEGNASDPDSHILLQDGQAILQEILPNATKFYRYETFNVTTMNQPDRYRKMVVSLEPCEGVVYLMVRKTRRCWPNPNSCCKALPGVKLANNESMAPPPCNGAQTKTKCDWTHFHSRIDGSADGAPTFFEVPLTSNKFYIAVYAPLEVNTQFGITKASFRLMVLTDIGAYPRPGQAGQLRVQQKSGSAVELSWGQATFLPAGISDIKRYHIFSSLLLTSEGKTNPSVFLNPVKVMNSVCGLERNAVRYGIPLNASSCRDGICNATISGIVPGRRYMFNVVSESMRDLTSSYSGIIVAPEWHETTQLMSDGVVSLIGAICGTMFGVIVIGYLWIVKLYN